jgi:hypothetical protein
MTDQRPDTTSHPRPALRARRAGIAAFVTGALGVLAFFGFFPGLPHVIDWGAVLVSLVAGATARSACLSWLARKQRQERGDLPGRRDGGG